MLEEILLQNWMYLSINYRIYQSHYKVYMLNTLLQKDSAYDYQIAKNSLIKAFEKSGLGTWVRKPAEQDLFEYAEMENDQ